MHYDGAQTKYNNCIGEWPQIENELVDRGWWVLVLLLAFARREIKMNLCPEANNLTH